jgi:hypothetical protein
MRNRIELVVNLLIILAIADINILYERKKF